MTHDGTEVSVQGDGFFAVFSSPRACVAAAVEMQRALGAQTWPTGERVRVRMGIHCGEATETSTTGLVGFEVHRAARVAAVAHGGQVILSAAAGALVQDGLPGGVTLRDLGLHRLKDLGRPEQIFQLQAVGLEDDFPPLRSLDNPALANNLPAQSATFIGRRSEVTEIRQLVEAGRLVTLTGAGGSGKTRLGLQVAADLLDGSGDGVWLVELAPVRDHDGVPAAIMEALRIPNQPGRAALDALLDALEPQDILIVLDNCEHLIGACAKVVDAVLRRCPQVHFITTSREPLGIGGEAIYRVPSMSLPEDDTEAIEGNPERSDAVALFVDRAAAQGVELTVNGQTIVLVVSICRCLDGMPLAIELAVARLRSMSLTDLHGRLDQRFRLLTGGSRSALPRQQTLRATVDWSYSLLNGPEKSLLPRLSAFVEGFDLDAAEAVCGFGEIDVFDVTDLLGSLVDKSLVVAEPVNGSIRYRLLETIRQFSVERLLDDGEDAAAILADAHGEYFLAVVESACPELTGPDQGRWMARLFTDQANLRRAFEYLVGRSEAPTRAFRFAIAVRRYWWVHPPGDELFSSLLGLLDRPDANADPRLLGDVLASIAFNALKSNLVMMSDYAEQAAAIARQFGYDRLLVEALSQLCAQSYFSGRVEQGFPYGEEAVERARALGNDVQLAESLTMFLLCKGLMDPTRAQALFDEAAACTERTGDHFEATILLNNAGCHALQSGDTVAARAHLLKSEEFGRMIGWDFHNTSVNLGWVEREEGKRDAAIAFFNVALRSARRNGDRSGLGYAILGHACLGTDLGEWHRAAVLHGAAQAFLAGNRQAWGEPEESYRTASIDAAKNQIGDVEFDRAYAMGAGFSLERAFEETLGDAMSSARA